MELEGLTVSVLENRAILSRLKARCIMLQSALDLSESPGTIEGFLQRAHQHAFLDLIAENRSKTLDKDRELAWQECQYKLFGYLHDLLVQEQGVREALADNRRSTDS